MISALPPHRARIYQSHAQTNMAASREEYVPKKGTVSSVIWNWFVFARSDLEQTTPRCKVCSKSVASKGSSTTNLLQHLRQKHPAEWEKCCAQRNEGDRGTTSTTRTATKIQTTVTQSFANCIPYEKNSARWKAITDAIAMYIAKDMVPKYTVEKPGLIYEIYCVVIRIKLYKLFANFYMCQG